MTAFLYSEVERNWRASVTAFTSIAMLEAVSSTAPEPSETVTPLTLAVKAHPDFSSRFTEPSVKTITSSGPLTSSIVASISAFAAPGAHSRHSLPRSAMTAVNCSASSEISSHASPLLILLTERHWPIVAAAWFVHSLPLLSLEVYSRPILL